MVCKIAVDVLEEVGMAGHFDYHLLTGLSSLHHGLIELDKYSDAVLTAFGKVASEYEKENETSMRDEVVKKHQVFYQEYCLLLLKLRLTLLRLWRWLAL